MIMSAQDTRHSHQFRYPLCLPAGFARFARPLRTARPHRKSLAKFYGATMSKCDSGGPAVL
jgi:hypothetical protein